MHPVWSSQMARGCSCCMESSTISPQPDLRLNPGWCPYSSFRSYVSHPVNRSHTPPDVPFGGVFYGFLCIQRMTRTVLGVKLGVKTDSFWSPIRECSPYGVHSEVDLSVAHRIALA